MVVLLIIVWRFQQNPSCISISVMKNSYTNELIEKSKKFAISILNKDVSSEMVKKFELFSGRKNDKFQNISTVMDKNNVPYVTKKCKHCHKR